MGWIFRRSIRILPGVRLNFGKKSASISVGGRGLTFNKSTTGRSSVTTGLRGTGLRYRHDLSKARKTPRKNPAPPTETETRIHPPQSTGDSSLIKGIIIGVVITAIGFLFLRIS